MDANKTGKIIRKLRLEKGLTQKELSHMLGVEAKTVSKWETGMGFPDVSLIPPLSKALGAQSEVFFSGDMTPSHENAESGFKFYACPSCGSFYFGSGNASLTCCHKALLPLSPKMCSYGEIREHAKNRDHYISYKAEVFPDSVTVTRFSPGEEIDLSKKDLSALYFLCTKHSLLCAKEEKGAKKEAPGMNLTALISAFARAYCKDEGVFYDPYARALFSDAEYEKLLSYMPGGDYILNNLAPSPLFRSRLFAEAAETDRLTGTEQIVIAGAGLDTFSLTDEGAAFKIFELDKEDVLNDKIRRLERAHLALPENVTLIPSDLSDLSGDLLKNGFDPGKKTLFSCLGLFYYLSKEEISAFFKSVASFAKDKSSVIFDFPDSHFFTSENVRTRETSALALSSSNPMKCALSYLELEKLLSDAGFLIYEFLPPDDINSRCFSGTRLSAIPHVNFCRAVLVRR